MSDAAAKPEKPKGSKLTMIIMLFVMANVGVTGFVGFKLLPLLKASHAAAPAKAEGEAAGEAGEKAEPAEKGEHGEKSEHGEKNEKGDAVPEVNSGPVAGPMLDFEPFIVNLNETTSNRYLKLTFQLELVNSKVTDEITRAKPALRDEIIRYLSSLTVAQTLGEENKEKIQEELLARVRKLMGVGKARKLFFTDFVVQ